MQRFLMGVGWLLFTCSPLAAQAFPGGQTFTGKVKCVTTYNGGSSGPFPSTDVVTLAFSEVSTDVTQQTGTVVLTHTEGSAAGIQLDDEDPLLYNAFTNPDETDAGLVGIQDPDNDSGVMSGGVASFKEKPGAPISALSFLFVTSDISNGNAQRCTGTLKALRPV